MAGGKSIRRRARLMEKANQGNLHKAAKGRASAHLPLPPAPGIDDYKEKVPASLAKMMHLKAAVLQPSKKLKVENDRPKTQQQQSREQQGQQQVTQPAPLQTKSANGSTKDDITNAKQGALLWEQPKKLKQRRKDYLNAKKVKKMAGRKGLGSEEVLWVDKPAFGEVAHAPPKVQLKRKHREPAAAAARAANSSGKGGKQQQQQQQQVQRHQGARSPNKKMKQDPVVQELREQMIEEYRAGRRPREGRANLDTLKKLVH